MLTHFYESRYVIDQLRSGPGGAHIDGFAQELWDAGYAPITARRHVRAAQHLLYWTQRKHVRLEDLEDLQILHFKRHLARCRCYSYGHSDKSLVKGARLFVEYLRHAGVVALSAVTIEPAPFELLVAFQHWMRENRNVSDGTLYNYSLAVRDLLQTIGENPRHFDARSLRAFVLERCQGSGTS